MAVRGWTKRSYGCAVAGEACLAVGVRYHVAERRLHVEEAWSGRLADKAFAAKLARRLGRKPLWVPLALESDGERGDLRIMAIDDEDGRLKGGALQNAVVTQLQGEEANKLGAYTRVSAWRELAAKQGHVVGASAPTAAVERTRAAWGASRRRGVRVLLQRLLKRRQRRDGGAEVPPRREKELVCAARVLNPCVGSPHAAAVNLFLALHPDAAAEQPVHRLLAFRADGIDLFAYLKHQALIDSGVSTGVSGTLENLLDHLGAWGGKFEQKHHFGAEESIRAYVVQAEPPDDRCQAFIDKHLEFWAVPWGSGVTFAADAVERTVREAAALAVPALGLALHGV